MTEDWGIVRGKVNDLMNLNTRNGMKINSIQCKLMHLGINNKQHTLSY